MKKGHRRKANKRRNRRQFVVPQGVKSKKKHNNPLFDAKLDAKAMRAITNRIIGTMLVNSLKIDFIGIMEEAERAERSKPETIQ